MTNIKKENLPVCFAPFSQEPAAKAGRQHVVTPHALLPVVTVSPSDHVSHPRVYVSVSHPQTGDPRPPHQVTVITDIR